MSQLAFVAFCSYHRVPLRRVCLLHSLWLSYAAITPPLPVLLLRLNKPTSLSLCLYTRCSRGHPGGLCWTHSNVPTPRKPKPRGTHPDVVGIITMFVHAAKILLWRQENVVGLIYHKNTLLSAFQLLVSWDLQAFLFCNTASTVQSVQLHGTILSYLQEVALACTETPRALPARYFSLSRSLRRASLCSFTAVLPTTLCHAQARRSCPPCHCLGC